jgi:hypothetical protein
MIQLTKADLAQLPEGTQEMFHLKLTRLFEPEPKVVYEGPGQLLVTIYEDSRLKYKGKRQLTLHAVHRGWTEYVIDERRAYHDLDVEEDGTCVIEDYQMEVFRYEEGEERK